jgi:hypothetical protein
MIKDSKQIHLNEQVSVRVLAEHPGDNSEALGSSPGLTTYLLDALSQEPINLLRGLWYLYNNQRFHSQLCRLSENGADVLVYSIPLEGYSTIKRGIREPFSKYDAAKIIYSDSREHTGILRAYPEVLVRSARMNRFSRGQLPYALHAKALYFESDRHENLFVTSSNMAAQDDQKIEIALHIQARKPSNLKSIQGYFEMQQRLSSQVLIGDAPLLIHTSSSWTLNSNSGLCRILESLARRDGGPDDIMLAQHVSGINERLVDGRMFVSPLFKMIDDGVIKKIVSQTSASGDRRTVKNNRANIALEEYAFRKGIEWRVHDDLHAKYLVRGDYSLITTSNFTNTSLIWLEDTQLGADVKTPFSEVGVSVVIKSLELASFLKQEGLNIWSISKEIKQAH